MSEWLTQEFYESKHPIETLFVMAESDMRWAYKKHRNQEGIFDTDREALLAAIAEYKRMRKALAVRAGAQG